MADDAAATEYATTNKDEWGDTDKEYYKATISLITSSEAVTWSRLTSFGFLAGFIFTAIKGSDDAGFNLLNRAGLAYLGFGMSVLYCYLMVRSRWFVRKYVANARKIEETHPGLHPMRNADPNDLISASKLAPLIPYLVSVYFLVVYANLIRGIEDFELAKVFGVILTMPAEIAVGFQWLGFAWLIGVSAQGSWAAVTDWIKRERERKAGPVASA